MAHEIERKFLVKAFPPAGERESKRIEQGYLVVPGDRDPRVEVRLRRIRSNECFLTVKSGESMNRIEVEVPLSSEQFEALWPLTDGRRIVKERFSIPLENDLTADLDVYCERLDGLRVVEVEFGSETAANNFAIPEWFGTEITGDPQFRNAALAMSGNR